MNRTTLLLIAVLLVGTLAYLGTSLPSSPASIAQKTNDRQFAYPQTEDIARIFIADRKGHEVTLERGGPTGWTVRGKGPANENVMKNLLEAVSRIDIQTLPAYAAVPNLVNSLAGSGILVQVVDADGRKLRGYYVGGSTSDERGTAAIMEGSENPYIVHMPGFTGNIRFRYNLWDDEWRSKVVLRADPDEVEALEVRYPTRQNQSFRLERSGGDYRLTNPDDGTVPARTIPRGVAEGILTRYEKFYASRFENGERQARTAAEQKLPFATIAIDLPGPQGQRISIYPKFREKGFTTDVKSGEHINIEGVESYHALVNNGEDWVLLSPNTTEPLFVGYGSF